MVRTQIQLTEEQYQALKTLANDNNVSVSELIRQGVDQVIVTSHGISLSERRKRAIAIAGRFHSKDKSSHVSTEHDSYLADIYSS
jgi:hypothetical protein